MLTLHTLTLGAYQTNCYILHQEDSSSCVVIDPGYTPEVILGGAVSGLASTGMHQLFKQWIDAYHEKR